jgi:5-formyltetrahydrofolate cyclo-ligase
MWRVANEEKKLALRRAVLTRRKALTKQECLHWSGAIQSRALQLLSYQNSRSVALYSAAQNEVSTDKIFHNALASGRRVFYPRTLADGMGEFIAVACSTDLCAGGYGLREPSGNQRLLKDDAPDLVVFVPGIAFDDQGNRLGRGHGWYDRMLAWLEDKAVLVGLAYEFQIVVEVPTEVWDRRVHFIVTENRVVDCLANTTSEPGSAVNCKQ